MRGFQFLLPTKRPSYRVVERRGDWKFLIQQRYRWLWSEWWRTIDKHLFEDMAESEMRRLVALDNDADPEHVIICTIRGPR